MDKAILCFQAPVMFSATFLTRATANQIWIISRNFKVLCFQGGILYEKCNQNFFTWIKNSQFSAKSNEELKSCRSLILELQTKIYQRLLLNSEFRHGCSAGLVKPGLELTGLSFPEVLYRVKYSTSDQAFMSRNQIWKKFWKKLTKVFYNLT